ncbi:transposase [Ferrithrix thermotolerans DSM 19514]|uniref:Transposase n=1 Tax=Ferrithrix thermotolerans DSM 19514 TaxID=1121881 RepID=A0A1M4SA95_9ACTN|nr:transposase [Ferrithrix thermotolerans]SHE29121.1 transposase [Ferrithrix thermotolerans DSM 19514]
MPNKLGMSAKTLRHWVRQAKIDAGDHDEMMREAKDPMRALEQENTRLRRANEILKAASIFFATELDGRPGARRSK